MLRAYLDHFRALQRNARLFVLSNAIVNVSVGALGLLYTVFLTRLGYGTDFLGALLVVGIAGAGVGLAPAVIIANRVSARRLLLWSNILGGVAVGVQLVFTQGWVLVATTLVVGSSVSIFIVLTPPLLAATSSDEERAHLFSLNAALGFLTGVIGTALGGVLPLLMSAPAVIDSPLVRVARPLLAHGAVLPLQLALFVAGLIALPSQIPLMLMDYTVIGLAPGAAPAPFALPARGTWWGLGRGWARRWLRWSTVRAAMDWPAARYVGYLSFLGLGAGLFLTYINLYLINHLGTGTALYGGVASLSTVLLAVVTLVGPLVARRVGTVRAAIFTQICAVPLVVALALTTSVPLAVVVFLARNMLMNVCAPSLQSFVMGIVPAGERSAASSVFTVNWQVMLALGGVTSGVLIAHAGYRVTFLLAAACYAAGMLWMTPWIGREGDLRAGVKRPLRGIAVDRDKVHERGREFEVM